MKLHKLIYYAHGWHLGYKRGPLLDETLEAWQYGPVVPSVHREFLEFGASPITRSAQEFDWDTMEWTNPTIDHSDTFVRSLLDRVWEVYGEFTVAQLSGLTHASESPWSVTRKSNPGVRHAGIPNSVVKEHFEDRVRRNRVEE